MLPSRSPLAAALVPVERLVARLRPRCDGRASDLGRLRARFTAQPSRWVATRWQRELAARLVALKRELAAAFEGVSSCSTCALGEPLPKGRWSGGRCCGTRTDVPFTPAEVYALKLAGVSAGELAPPDDEPAGCAFRGATGCSLDAGSRPTVCLVFACADLKLELRADPRRERIHALRAGLHATFEALLRASGDTHADLPPPASLVER